MKQKTAFHENLSSLRPPDPRPSRNVCELCVAILVAL